MNRYDTTSPDGMTLSIPHETPTVSEYITIPLSHIEFERRHTLALVSRQQAAIAQVGATIADVGRIEIGVTTMTVEVLVPVDCRPVWPAGAAADSPHRVPPDLLAEMILPVIDALAALHDAGIALGGITLSSLRRRADGAPVLVALEPRARPADDVRAIASVILDLVPVGGLSGEAAGLLMRALDDDESLRPTMMQVAAGIQRWQRRDTGSPRALRRPPRDDRGDALHQLDSPRQADPVALLRRDAGHRRSGARSRRRGRVPGRSIRSYLVTAAASSAVTWILAAAVFGPG